MKINLTDEQARVLMDALDLYTRVHLGQFEAVADVALEYNISTDEDCDCSNFHSLRNEINHYKWVWCGFNPNSGFGIHSKRVAEHGKMCYDMKQVIRYHLAWKHHPEGGSTVNFDTPLQIAEHPLCEIIEE